MFRHVIVVLLTLSIVLGSVLAGSQDPQPQTKEEKKAAKAAAKAEREQKRIQEVQDLKEVIRNLTKQLKEKTKLCDENPVAAGSDKDELNTLKDQFAAVQAQIQKLAADVQRCCETESVGKCPTAAPAGETNAAPTGEATSAPSGEATSAPSGGATSAPSGEANSAPSGGATSSPSEGAVSAPSGEATSAPSGEATPAQSGGATSVPSEGANSAPSGGATSAPSGEATLAPSEGATSAPSGGATSAPSGEATSAPSVEATSAPSGGATSAPSGEATSAPSGEATSAPSEELIEKCHAPLRNVALNKSATQSSTYQDTSAAQKAVDGNRDPYYLRAFSCAITNPSSQGAWWQVDLGGLYSVDSVFITNIHEYPNQTRDYEVRVYTEDPTSNTANTGTLCFRYDGEMIFDETPRLTCQPGRIKGRYVRVINSPNNNLTLCEVQVMEYHLKDFSIKVYQEDPIINPNAPATLCTFHPGAVEKYSIISLACDDGPAEGRYVRITDRPWLNLELCEVEVFATEV